MNKWSLGGLLFFVAKRNFDKFSRFCAMYFFGEKSGLVQIFTLFETLNDDNDAIDAAFHPPKLFIIRLHQV